MSLFPTKVVVGVEVSNAAANAVDAARELCALSGSELHLVHVKLTRSSLRGRPLTPAQREAMEQEGQALLERTRTWVEDQGGAVAATHLRFAEQVESELVRAQEELGAGLLVISASRSPSLVQRLFGSGTVSAPAGPIRPSPGSVLVVREPAA
jgi:nucleotide-binding universal stress UspA family protein